MNETEKSILQTITGAMDLNMDPDWPECSALYDLAAEVEDGAIVELGSWRGRSTVALAFGARSGHGARIYSVDPHSEMPGVDLGVPFGNYGPGDWRHFYWALVKSDTADLVWPIGLSSAAALEAFKYMDLRIGLLWIDAEHTYEATRHQVFDFIPLLTVDAPIAMDDRDAPGVSEVIEEMKEAGWKVQPVGQKVAVCRR
jgi:hypothetical protein